MHIKLIVGSLSSPFFSNDELVYSIKVYIPEFKWLLGKVPKRHLDRLFTLYILDTQRILGMKIGVRDMK